VTQTLPDFSIAPFRFDVTPPLGHALLGGLIRPAEGYDDSLEAIGYVLLGAGAPLVVCAVDWAGLMNAAHLAWRTALARGAGTTPERVAVQCVHQHNAPFACPTARAAAAQQADLPAMFDPVFFETCLSRATEAVQSAIPAAQRITHIAHGETRVAHVASNRRVARDPAGRVTAIRESACTNPELIALPEGTIDPTLQTIAFYGEDGRKLVACHYYATHPMSYYRDGRVSSDFCGLARKRQQAGEPDCTHLYFTGCAGDISAGKYNDGSPASRVALTDRMHAAMSAVARTLVPQPLTRITWKTTDVLPPPLATLTATELSAIVADPQRPRVERLLAAFRLGWLCRVASGVPLVLSCLTVNDTAILHLPGEMFVEYQLRARALRPGRPVAVAAYGDDGLWYVPTKAEYSAGGYEVSVAFSRDDVDGIMMDAIARLLG
jgi:hypothetical protein